MNKTIIGTLVGATLLAGGCGTVAREMERLAVWSSPTPGTPSATSPPGSATASPGPADLKAAAQAALAAVPGSRLISIETEENGTLWEVQVVGRDGTEHEMDVQAGKVVRGPATEGEDAADKAKHRERVAAAKLDYAQAADKILAAVPEGRITELNLDGEAGRTVWESDVVTSNGVKREVAIDAATGTVTRNNGTTT
ncbi:Peptidase propeptide and YPEB domain-containing protein [Nonomuraea solani]|uniref:Peptidase propeptide and YPEB domain-containing protein n=1 Tax=Nonomuraea solani TaxID=1144553 RepID=A0A1H6DCS7_9ACTN|nr:PepSY domain-containing protein [Nonomuraea solani]SEG83100.1 Peptidase propeptide and YPEB domain-containing protein [Nonomuraea solani]